MTSEPSSAPAAEIEAVWPRVRLVDLVDGRGITYGVVQPGQPQAQGTPILRVANLTAAGLRLDEVMRIDPAIADRYGRSRLVGGEVVITLVGSVGQVAVVPAELAGWNVARAVGIVPVRQDVPARWVAWCLRSPEVQRYLQARLNTTVQSTLNLRDLASVEVPMPPRATIRAITSILGALDDKIESNGRLADLFEETAAALFRARFVDFVGVEEFEDSEIGAIPRGWSTGSVYELSKVTYGRPFQSRLFNESDGTPLIRIRDLSTDEPSVLTPEVRPDARLVRRRDIVVGMDGEFRAHVWSGPDAWLNQRVCLFDPLDETSRAFLVEAIKRPLAFYEATKGGTTVIHLGKRDIDTFRLVVPPRDVMRDFGSTADPLLAHAVELRWESRLVTNIRDALLPKLISGEIRLPPPMDEVELRQPASEPLATAP